MKTAARYLPSSAAWIARRILALALTVSAVLYLHRTRHRDHDRVLRAVRECYTEGVLA